MNNTKAPSLRDANIFRSQIELIFNAKFRPATAIACCLVSSNKIRSLFIMLSKYGQQASNRLEQDSSTQSLKCGGHILICAMSRCDTAKNKTFKDGTVPNLEIRVLPSRRRLLATLDFIFSQKDKWKSVLHFPRPIEPIVFRKLIDDYLTFFLFLRGLARWYAGQRRLRTSENGQIDENGG